MRPLVKLSKMPRIDTTADNGRPDPHLLARLARPSGGLAMVAIDQRESLRAMFEAARGVAATDDLLADFKAAVAEILSPHASAMLVDAPHGRRALTVLADAPACGSILALDAFDQEPGAPIARTDVDETIDVAAAAAAGVVGFKLLLMWNADGGNADECVDIARRFLDRAHAVGRLGVVEVMVRPPATEPAEGWDRDAVLVTAARAMAALGPDLYKTEVPTLGAAPDDRIAAIAEALSTVLPCPWVVLSSGVEPARFPSAVEAACRGGASGFLAGRAIWRETLAADDYRLALAGEAVVRLERRTRSSTAPRDPGRWRPDSPRHQRARVPWSGSTWARRGSRRWRFRPRVACWPRPRPRRRSCRPPPAASSTPSVRSKRPCSARSQSLASDGLEPLAIATASMGETGVILGEDGSPRTPMIAWRDLRAAGHASVLSERIDARDLYAITGHASDAHFAIARLMWLHEHCPGAFAPGATWLSAADLATFWLTGERADGRLRRIPHARARPALPPLVAGGVDGGRHRRGRDVADRADRRRRGGRRRPLPGGSGSRPARRWRSPGTTGCAARSPPAARPTQRSTRSARPRRWS